MESIGTILVLSLTFMKLDVLSWHAFKAFPGTYVMWERENCQVASPQVNLVAHREFLDCIVIIGEYSEDYQSELVNVW